MLVIIQQKKPPVGGFFKVLFLDLKGEEGQSAYQKGGVR